jgi:chemotaxis protein CheZ
MMVFEKEDLEELMQLLEDVRQTAASLTDGENQPKNLEAVRQGLQSFHTTAAMLGLSDIERSGLALQDFFINRISAVEAVDAGLVLSFVSAIKAILSEMKNCLNGQGEPVFNVDAVIEILYSIPDQLSEGDIAGELTEDELPSGFSLSSDVPGDETEGAAAADEGGEAVGDAEKLDVSDLDRITRSLGGKLLIEPEDGGGKCLRLSFPLSGTNIQRIQTMLSTCELNLAFTTKLTQQDSRVEKVLHVFEQFMIAFSSGDFRQAQEILMTLAEQQQQAGLYKQIGVLARQLHDSLKGFAETLDPTLVEIVEDKIPDSGSRLEHILKLTDRAANTTLDHVEAMQKRNQDQQTTLARLKDLHNGMRAVGDKAQDILTEARQSLDALQESVSQTSVDLITVLTAQDYQDITGQIILKIIALLNDLESNLVNVIRTFGVRVDGQKETVTEELYGPAHEGVTNAMHSQDDVDSLLAEFGF